MLDKDDGQHTILLRCSVVLKVVGCVDSDFVIFCKTCSVSVYRVWARLCEVRKSDNQHCIGPLLHSLSHLNT